MRIAAIGDIHSNHIALERCIEWIDKNHIDAIAFLGDYVTDCPYPQKTISLLRDLQQRYTTWFVRGNREEYMINYRKDPTDWRYSSKSGALLYTYENLTEEDLDWFESMPKRTIIRPEGCPPLILVHRPPYYESGQKLPPRRLLEKAAADIAFPLVCAHSHVAAIYHQDNKLIVNTGSLGMPNEHITAAQFAVLEYDGSWSAQTITLDYDREAVCAEFLESDLLAKSYVWGMAIQQTLRTGENCSVNCLNELKHLLAEMPDKNEYDEALWEQAAKKCGITGI